jgi:outer membrane lipoprotein-sorting protein
MTKRLALLVLVLIMLAGCRAGLRPGQRMARKPPAAPALSSEQILAQLKARQGTLSAFDAKGRLTLISPEQNATGTALLKGKLPETLKVDIKDPLGRAVLNFYTDGQVVEILFPRENKLLQGPATPTNLAAFVPPGVKVNQVLRLLAGDLPFSQGPPARLQPESGDNLTVLEWVKSDGSLQERLWVSTGEVQPRKQEWYGADGQVAFSAELGEFGKLAPGRPQQVKLVTANPRVELRFTFKEFTPNTALSPAELAVPRPAGVMVQPLKP